MVLDGVERKAQQRSSFHPDDRGWGNDCLVSIESAKWGEFLGVLEGCDHWEMRGARSLDLNVDFSSVSMPSFARPLMKRTDQEWNLKDWSKFVKLWKTEEDKAAVSESMKTSHSQMPSQSSIDEGDLDREKALKSSTDKVSAVLDWIVDQVPATNKDPQRDQKQRDLATKEGLERLYVALSRKLYDEGL
jgi:triacylglycerol lipase